MLFYMIFNIIGLDGIMIKMEVALFCYVIERPLLCDVKVCRLILVPHYY